MITLQKNDTISLTKENTVTGVCVGVNWGAIVKKSLFGFGTTTTESVDLDASALLYDADGKYINMVYFGRLSHMGIIHSGDDRTGDTDGDDGLDNEVIYVDTNSLDRTVKRIVFVLNSYSGQVFNDIPFASIRLYKGTPDVVNEVICEYNVANDKSFNKTRSMVLASFYKDDEEWKFKVHGDPLEVQNLSDIRRIIDSKYVR